MTKYIIPDQIKKLENIKPVDEKIFQKFISDEMTVKEMKDFSETIENRFTYIIYKIGEITSFKLEWFDYDNEGGENYPGVFDTTQYDSFVGYTGKFIYDKNTRYEEYDESFPTKWFYTDFEEELIAEVKSFL